MERKDYQLFQISQVGVWICQNKCLILKYNQNDAKWGLPGGRIDEGELQNGITCEEAFRREIEEELGIKDFRVGDVIGFDYTGMLASSPNQIGRMPVAAVAKLIFSDDNNITLSPEHLEFRWITVDEVVQIDFKWPCTQEMIRKGFELINKQ